MIAITERDMLFMRELAARGWCSVKYLSRFFPSHQAALQRLAKFEKEKLIERKNILEIINSKNLQLRTLQLCNHYTIRTNFVKISSEAYSIIGIKNRPQLKEEIVVHQIYQEFVEVYLVDLLGVKRIESNPNMSPKPDLHFKYNDISVSVEIERKYRKPRVSTKKEPSYQDYIDKLLTHSERIIYLFETEIELDKFRKEKYSKRVFSSVIYRPFEVFDYTDKVITIKEALSG